MVDGIAVNALRRLVALCHTCDFALKSPNTIFVALHTSFVIHLISSRQLYTMSLFRSARVLRLSRPVSLARSYATPPTPSTAPLPKEQPDASSPRYLQQSPNVPTTWSTNQNPKPHAYDNARFEQTAWEYQPNRPSAMGMVAEDPVRLVQGRKAACDGGESMDGCCWVVDIGIKGLTAYFCRWWCSWSSQNFYQSCESLPLDFV